MEMVCSNCSRSIKIGDGLKCSKCDSPYHVACGTIGGGGGGASDQRHAGDFRNLEWKCYVCRTPSTSPRRETNLAGFLVSMNEKIELINKIQLPKLSSELLHLKNVSDVLAKQNVEILRKLKLQESSSPAPPTRRGCARANIKAFKSRNLLARIVAYFSVKKKRRRN